MPAAVCGSAGKPPVLALPCPFVASRPKALLVLGDVGFAASMNRLLLGDRERSGQSKQAATVGIRGFSKEDVERAELNPAELEKLKRYQASSSQAQTLAAQGRLGFRSVAYLAQDAVEAVGKQGAKK